jgi:hypothetical protein
VITGDKLSNEEFLLNYGSKEIKTASLKPINETRQRLQENLMSLSEGGPTALGPALAGKSFTTSFPLTLINTLRSIPWLGFASSGHGNYSVY